jgi:hypothetical protein
MVALFALRLSDLQAKSHDKKVPVLIMGNVRYRIFADLLNSRVNESKALR